MFVDSHCHLDFEQFDSDRDVFVARARAAGVERILTISTCISNFPKVLKVAESYGDVYCSVGVHPHDAEKAGELITADELVKYLDHPKVVAIGETGLDYFYEYAPREAQQRNFRQHIRACIASGVPLIVHTRDAEDDTIRILKEERTGHESELRGVLHCFSSAQRMADYGLEIGFSLSVSGMLTFKKSENIRDIVKDIPLDRLLIETDSPYLAPIPFRGKTCEPAYVVHTAAALANLKGVQIEVLAKATTDNFYRLFNRIERI
ncbi:MAG: TatD family hydrolase [Alphaproteobacteria bacterium]|nr:TatD family hydrolase [Alphaproteobacteria bacterium]